MMLINHNHSEFSVIKRVSYHTNLNRPLLKDTFSLRYRIKTYDPHKKS